MGDKYDNQSKSHIDFARYSLIYGGPSIKQVGKFLQTNISIFFHTNKLHTAPINEMQDSTFIKWLVFYFIFLIGQVACNTIIKSLSIYKMSIHTHNSSLLKEIRLEVLNHLIYDNTFMNYNSNFPYLKKEKTKLNSVASRRSKSPYIALGRKNGIHIDLSI